MSTVITGVRPTVDPAIHKWRLYKEGEAYQCEVILGPEEAGQISVYAASLPGVASQGQTEHEALENIRYALRAAIVTYREYNEAIPWSVEPTEPGSGEKKRWIIVHV